MIQIYSEVARLSGFIWKHFRYFFYIVVLTFIKCIPVSPYCRTGDWEHRPETFQAEHFRLKSCFLYCGTDIEDSDESASSEESMEGV